MKISLCAKSILINFYHSIALSSLVLTTATGTLMTSAVVYTLSASSSQADTLTDTTITADADYDDITISGTVIVSAGEESDTTLSTDGTLTLEASSNFIIDENQTVTAAGYASKNYSILTNTGTFEVEGETFTFTNNKSEENRAYIYNNGDLTINYTGTGTTNTIDILAYNTIYNYDGASLTLDAGDGYVRLRSNSSIINTGTGSVDISALQIYYAGQVVNKGSGTITIGTVTSSQSGSTGGIFNEGSGSIYITTLTLSNDKNLSNSGSGLIQVTTTTLSGTALVTNSDEGTIDLGETTIKSTNVINNTGEGNIIMNSLVSYSGSAINNTGSGTISIGTAGSTSTLVTGSSIYNGTDGTLSLDGIIILQDSELITNDGTLSFGEDLVFDISALTVNEEGIYQIFSTDSTSADLSSLTIDNITGYDADPADVTIEFNETGGFTMVIAGTLEYSGTGGTISLSGADSFDGGEIYENGSSNTITFTNPEETTGTASNLVVDAGAEASIRQITVDANYALTMSANSANDALAISTLIIGENSTLTLESDQITYDTLNATSSSALILGGEGQNYKLDAATLTVANSSLGSITLNAGTTMTIDGEGTIAYTVLTNIYAGTDEAPTTIAVASDLWVTVSTGAFYFADSGVVEFNVGEGSTLKTTKASTMADGAEITFVKSGEGTFYLSYKFGTSVENCHLIIEEGNFTISNASTYFADITIQEGATFQIDSNTTFNWSTIANTIYMEGGSFVETSGKSGNHNSTGFSTLELTSGDNTLDFSGSSLSSFTFTNAIQGGDNDVDGNLKIVGKEGLTITMATIENLNATVSKDDSTSVNVGTISNESGDTTNFVGEYGSTAFVKTGDGDAVFDTLNATESVTISGEGTLTVNESLTVAGITISAKSATLLLVKTAADGTSITITHNGEGDSGTISGDTLTALNISDATVSADSDITLDQVSLSNVDISAADSTVTLSNMGSVSDSSITAADLVINVSEGAGLEIVSGADGSLTYTITALDGFANLTITDDITLALDLTIEQEEAFETALANGNSVSIVVNNDLISNIESAESVLVSIGDSDYTASLSGDEFYIDSDVIPEPSTTSLGLLALAGLLARRRRK